MRILRQLLKCATSIDLHTLLVGTNIAAKYSTVRTAVAVHQSLDDYEELEMISVKMDLVPHNTTPEILKRIAKQLFARLEYEYEEG